MPTIKDIIAERLSRYESIPGIYISRVNNAQKTLLSDAIKLLGSLDSKNGFLIFNESNLRKVDTIINTLSNTLSEGEYASAISSFASEYPIQGKLVDGYYTNLLDSFNVKTSYKLTLQNSQTTAVKTLLDGVGLEFSNPARQLLSNAISQGQNFNQMTQTIEQLIIGNEQILGGLERYASTYATDLFSVADRSYSAAIGEDLGLEFIIYQGGLVRDSREFCRERAGKYFHRLEMEGWANGIREPSFLTTPDSSGNWQGKNRNTDSSNIFALAGGWNCTHIVDFITAESVPPDVVERARDAGYIK